MRQTGQPRVGRGGGGVGSGRRSLLTEGGSHLWGGG